MSRVIDRFNRAIEAAATGLTAEETGQLREAARRSGIALGNLQAKLSRRGAPDVSLPAMPVQRRFPVLPEPIARLFLTELDGIIAEMEREILVPAEGELGTEWLAELKRSIGQAWGWIVCDLQDPLWRQYPQMGPASR